MQLHIAHQLRKIAAEISESDKKVDLLKKIRDRYDIKVDPSSSHECVQALYESLKRLKPQLVKDCGIKVMGFDDLGPSREYYPNHGKYLDGTLVLNERLLDDPTLIKDQKSGSTMNKFEQTFYHELGHGWDDAMAPGEDDLSVHEEWTGISGWSEKPKKGLRRIRIRDRGCPEVVGEWYYSPEAKFTRFYARRNPWDDWADSFSYYVGDCKSFLPKDKVDYFDKRLSRYETKGT